MNDETSNVDTASDGPKTNPNTSHVSSYRQLTPEEIAALQREKRETSRWLRELMRQETSQTK
jgi:diadenosine tetraphosphate (Ap4A) HIT family hydrolase